MWGAVDHAVAREGPEATGAAHPVVEIGMFAGGIDDDDSTTYVSVTRGGKKVLTLSGRDIDMDRSQGEIGLFVPDAGYPFGEIPNWLIRQRSQVPDWAPAWVREARKFELR